MARAEIYQGWLEHNGKTVKIDNINYILRVDHYKAIYPYPHWVITVRAEISLPSTTKTKRESWVITGRQMSWKVTSPFKLISFAN